MNILEELSKYGVGRRMPSDAFFAEGDALCKTWMQLGVLEIDDEELCHEVVTKFPCDAPGCTLAFDSLLQYELHYNSSHRYYCSECKKRLPSPHILELHVLETHDSFFLAQAEQKPMYGCYIEDCPLKFRDPQERHAHCVSQHQFPPDYRFDTFCKQKSKKKDSAKRSDKGSVSNMEVDLPENKDEFKESGKKKKNRSKRQGHKTIMDSQEEVDNRASNEKVQSSDEHTKQKENKNQEMQESEMQSDCDFSEQLKECCNTEEPSFKMAENEDNSVKEKDTGQKKACKGTFQKFSFGRGQGRGGRFIPWHKKNTSHKNGCDVERNAQIWENADLMTALEESVMDT